MTGHSNQTPAVLPSVQDTDAADDPNQNYQRTSESLGKPDPEKSAKARPSTPHPATEKVSGAGPAMAEHSKDAKAPKSGRSDPAYVKPTPAKEKGDYNGDDQTK